MTRGWFCGWVIILLWGGHCFAQTLDIDQEELAAIGEKVFANECSGREECLVWWNEGEDFMSLGIGHFIWYPAGQVGPFEESFPRLVEFMRARGEVVPLWLMSDPVPPCPWNNRAEFLPQSDGEQARELRQWLAGTKAAQVAFLGERLRLALPTMMAAVPGEEQPRIAAQFDRLAATPSGLYVLVDYVNFKGRGVSPAEQYQGKGWGLLQVLQTMTGQDPGPSAVEEFAQAAGQLLAQRVKNAPPQRQEDRWLPGWQNRVATYRHISDDEQIVSSSQPELE